MLSKLAINLHGGRRSTLKSLVSFSTTQAVSVPETWEKIKNKTLPKRSKLTFMVDNIRSREDLEIVKKCFKHYEQLFIDPNVHTTASLARKCCFVGEPQEFFDILDETTRLKLYLEAGSFNTLMKTFNENSLPEKTLEAANSMRSLKVKPTSTTRHHILQAYIMMNDTDSVLSYLRELSVKGNANSSHFVHAANWLKQDQGVGVLKNILSENASFNQSEKLKSILDSNTA